MFPGEAGRINHLKFFSLVAMHIPFNDVDRYIDGYSAEVDPVRRDEMVIQSGQDLAKRSAVGTIIASVCFILGGLSAEAVQHIPVLFPVLGGFMIAGAVTRWNAIRRLKGDRDEHDAARLRFFWGSLCMAASWGLLAAMVVWIHGMNNKTMFIVVLTTGVSTGAVANFCIWRILACLYVLITFVPLAVVAMVVDLGMLYLIIGISIYLVYLMHQISEWNREYWRSVISSNLFEQQATTLAGANKELAEQMQELRHIQGKLEEGRNQQRQLFDNSQQGIVIVDLRKHILEVNRTLLEMFDIEGQHALDMQAFSDLAANAEEIEVFKKKWLRALKKGIVDFEMVGKRQRDGGPMFIHVNLKRMVWKDRDVMFISVQNIHKRKLAELERDHAKDSLRKSEGYLKAILEHTTVPVFCKGVNGRYLMINSRFEELVGRRRDEILGHQDRELFDGDLMDLFSLQDEAVKETGDSREFEKTLDVQGDLRTFKVFSFPLYDSEKELFGVGGICTDITDLMHAYNQAELASKSKTEFLANMSHELRTPMHGILSFARLGLKRIENVPMEKLKFYFEMIASSGQQLLDLLSDLLDLSMLDSKRMKYQIERSNLVIDMVAILNEYQAAADEKKITIREVFNTPAVHVDYDRVRIKQMIRNLLSNAVKFSPPASNIALSLDVSDGRPIGLNGEVVVVSIADEGIGIPETELESVFEKFVQSSRSKTGAGGSGLGLSICRQIVEDHHGRIWAEINECNGTTISFALPVRKVDNEIVKEDEAIRQQIDEDNLS